MIEATPMKASIALEHGYKIGNHSADELGYEISYPDGYKSWCPAEEFDKYYYHIQDENGDMLYRNDIKDQLWFALSFVLQWAKNGIKRNK